MRISALLDTEGLVGRHMTQIQSIGWLFSEQINVNVSVVSLYTLLGPWKHFSVVGKIGSLFHVRNKWLDLAGSFWHFTGRTGPAGGQEISSGWRGWDGLGEEKICSVSNDNCPISSWNCSGVKPPRTHTRHTYVLLENWNLHLSLVIWHLSSRTKTHTI